MDEKPEKPQDRKWWHGLDPFDIGFGIFIACMGIALIVAVSR